MWLPVLLVALPLLPSALTQGCLQSVQQQCLDKCDGQRPRLVPASSLCEGANCRCMHPCATMRCSIGHNCLLDWVPCRPSAPCYPRANCIPNCPKGLPVLLRDDVAVSCSLDIDCGIGYRCTAGRCCTECTPDDLQSCQQQCTSTNRFFKAKLAADCSCDCVDACQDNDCRLNEVCVHQMTCPTCPPHATCEALCPGTLSPPDMTGGYLFTCSVNAECQPNFYCDGGRCCPVDPCSIDNGGCQMLCLSTADGPVCTCPAGYTTDGKNCIPMNPCDQYYCEHNCIATSVGPSCSCHEGYTLNADQRTCDKLGHQDNCRVSPVPLNCGSAWYLDQLDRKCKPAPPFMCATPGNSFPSEQECLDRCEFMRCPSILCIAPCPNGFKKDEEGCQSCHCKGVCPDPVGFGICVEECSKDDSCPLAQMCCSNGCGHVCMAPVEECIEQCQEQCGSKGMVPVAGTGCGSPCRCRYDVCDTVDCYDGLCQPSETITPTGGIIEPICKPMCHNYEMPLTRSQLAVNCQQGDSCPDGYSCRSSPEDPYGSCCREFGEYPSCPVIGPTICDFFECSIDDHCDNGTKCCMNGCGSTLCMELDVDCSQDVKDDCAEKCASQRPIGQPNKDTECLGDRCECKDPCEDLDCPTGTVCQYQTVYCFRHPCPPALPFCASLCPSGEAPLTNDSLAIMCNADADCPMYGYKCIADMHRCCNAMEHPGTCPVTPPGGPQAICPRQCYSDMDCRMDQKCCRSSCGMVCMLPERGCSAEVKEICRIHCNNNGTEPEPGMECHGCPCRNDPCKSVRCPEHTTCQVTQPPCPDPPCRKQATCKANCPNGEAAMLKYGVEYTCDNQDWKCPKGFLCLRGGCCAENEIDKCHLAREPGPCSHLLPHWFFNLRSGRCEVFNYGGCLGNANRFETEDMCKGNCTDGGGDVCLLPPEMGPCEAAMRHWYHDPETRSCRTFTYGGCGGNRNNFKTEEACQKTCLKDMCRDCPPCMFGTEDEEDDRGCPSCECREVCPRAFRPSPSKPEGANCGLRGHPGRCPTGSYCHIDPVDRFAACCPSPCRDRSPPQLYMGMPVYCDYDKSCAPDYHCQKGSQVCCPKPEPPPKCHGGALPYRKDGQEMSCSKGECPMGWECVTAADESYHVCCPTKICSGGKDWYNCSHCESTCKNLMPSCPRNRICEPDCACPPFTVWHKGKCVSPRECEPELKCRKGRPAGQCRSHSECPSSHFCYRMDGAGSGACCQAQKMDICKMKPIYKPEYSRLWYFDYPKMKCDVYIFGGCKDGNCFNTKADCMRVCPHQDSGGKRPGASLGLVVLVLLAAWFVRH